MRVEVGPVTLECLVGNIVDQPDIDIIVNAANAALRPGGGVAGAIHRAAGPELARACAPFAPITPGEAVITEAYRLPNRFVIHCLGPVFGVDEPAAELLARCHVEALRLAEENVALSIAFPAISTGIFGYPIDAAAEVACGTVAGRAPSLEHVRLIRFVLFDEAAYRAFAKALDAAMRPRRIN